MRANVYQLIDVPVRLSIVARPRGGEYLTDEIASLRRQGIDALVSLLMRAERVELDLAEEASVCESHAIPYISFPIEDRSVPTSLSAAVKLVEELTKRLHSGDHVGIHCRMGLGRSAMMAAAVMLRMGFTPEAAFARIAAARGCEVPDTPDQRCWVERLAQSMRV